MKVGAKEGAIIGDAIGMVRDYGNAPANHITPKVLADMAKKSAKETGQKVTVLSEKQMEEEKMGGCYSLVFGSSG